MLEINALTGTQVEYIKEQVLKPRDRRALRAPEPERNSVTVVNDSGETIPAGAAMQPKAVVWDEDKLRPVIKVVKPNDTPADFILINGPRDIGTEEEDKYGQAATLPAPALWGPTFDNALNQIVGPKAGEWKLYNQRSGFMALSTPTSADDGPRKIIVGPAALASYAGLSGGGQVVAVSAGYTKITALTTSHVAPFGTTVSEVNNNITVDRDGAYFVTFTASVRYDTYPGASPIMALHKNGVAVASPAVAAQIELNNANYRCVAFNGLVRLSAKDVLDVRMNGPSQNVRFQVCEFTVHLVGVA